MYQKSILPYIIIPYFLTPNFFPFGALQTDRQTEGRTNFNTPLGISMYQKRILPHFIIPYFLTPSLFPFGAFQTDRRTEFFTPCYLSTFFSH